jgi:rod shape-determining protein MreC
MDARKKWLAFSFAVLAAGLLLLVRYQPALRHRVTDFWTPFMDGKADAELRVQEAPRFSKTKVELIRDIEALEAELANRRVIDQRLDRLEAENRELRRALHLPDHPDYVPLMAQVLTRDPASGGRRLRIDRGSDDGVQIGQPVTVNGFLLGRILEVTSHSAVVITLADPNCQVSTRITVDGIAVTGILNGRGQDQWRVEPYCLLTHLPRDLTYAEGLEVETSGYSIVIPPGIPIGITHRPDSAPLSETVDQLYKNVVVAPYAFREDFLFVCIWKRYYPGTVYESLEPHRQPAPIDGVRPPPPPAVPGLTTPDPAVPDEP